MKVSELCHKLREQGFPIEARGVGKEKWQADIERFIGVLPVANARRYSAVVLGTQAGEALLFSQPRIDLHCNSTAGRLCSHLLDAGIAKLYPRGSKHSWIIGMPIDVFRALLANAVVEAVQEHRFGMPIRLIHKYVYRRQLKPRTREGEWR